MKIETALVSVYDKTGLAELVRGLVKNGIHILSSGGTSQTLREAGIDVTEISDYTGFPEILDGRVKTLHPRVHAGILARHDDAAHRKVLEENEIRPIGLVVVNLYPFGQTIQRSGITLAEAVEQIDIGGPTLIRAAAKNHQHAGVVVDPGDYATVLTELENNSGILQEPTRRRLAAKAFHHTAAYDTVISGFLKGLEEEAPEELPSTISLPLERASSLRYGENPHQRAALYRPLTAGPAGLVAAHQHQGKELSFNNYLDLDSAWNLCREFEDPVCVIIKHTNPCGAALGQEPHQAYVRALACDPISAFGSIIAFNRTVDETTAEEMRSLFVEAVIAPAFEEKALQIFAKKKNLRIMEMGEAAGRQESGPQGLDFKKIGGGFLVQDRNPTGDAGEEFRVVSARPPTPQEGVDLRFAWSVCKHVKSNGIVLARGKQTVGVGAGQMSRVDSVRLAAEKAQLDLAGCIMASDGFFPFRDAVDAAAEVGATAVIQPGGSKRDDEAIQAANEKDMAMVFTGVRHFKH